MDTDVGETAHAITPPYDSYILRLWRTPPSDTWRASLQDVRDGSQINFTSVQNFVEFLTIPTLQKGDLS